MKRKKMLTTCLLLTACTATSPALAVSQAEEPTTGSVFTLGEIEVTADSEQETNTTIEKVTAEDIRQFNRTTVAKAATLVPGVTSSLTGGRNEQTLYVRGLDIKHVPLFLDGIPVYVPYDGYPDLGRFTTFDLSEIVISKGFTSVLYGPNTMGGAINIVTRKPEKEFEGEIGGGYSSGDTYNGYLNLGSNQGSWYVQGGASYLNSDYYPLSDDYEAAGAENGGHRDNSYYRDEKFNVKVGFTPNEKDEYAFNYTYQHGEKGTPPYAGTGDETLRYWQWPYWDKESYYFTSKTDFQNKAYVKTRIYYDTFENSVYSYDDATYSTISKKYAFRSWYDDYTYGASAEIGTTIIPNNTIKLALHTKTDVHREQNEGEPELTFKDRMFSVGLEDTITITDNLYAITGISYDTIKTLEAEDLDDSGTISDFDKATTDGLNPQLGLFYTIVENHQIHGSIARKTRLPSIKDKYSYKLGTAIPNPDLDPENSVNYEVGYTNTQFENIKLNSTVFYNDVKDYIQSTKVADPDDASATLNQNQNIGEVELSGLELEATAYLLDCLETGANYTYTHADNESTDAEIIDVPKHKIGAWLRYLIWAGLSAQVDGEYNSERYSEDDGSRVADAFTVINTKLGYKFTNGLYAEAGVDNVFDEDYALQEGYPEAGRTYFVNLRYIF